MHSSSKIRATRFYSWSVRYSDLYVTTHNTPNRQTSMPPWDSKLQTQQDPYLRPLGQLDCPKLQFMCSRKQIYASMFSTVPLISFLIIGKPSESKHLFIYYSLGVFKNQNPNWCTVMLFQYPLISNTIHHDVPHTKQVRPLHTLLRNIFATSVQRSSIN